MKALLMYGPFTAEMNIQNFESFHYQLMIPKPQVPVDMSAFEGQEIPTKPPNGRLKFELIAPPKPNDNVALYRFIGEY